MIDHSPDPWHGTQFDRVEAIAQEAHELLERAKDIVETAERDNAERVVERNNAKRVGAKGADTESGKARRHHAALKKHRFPERAHSLLYEAAIIHGDVPPELVELVGFVMGVQDDRQTRQKRLAIEAEIAVRTDSDAPTLDTVAEAAGVVESTVLRWRRDDPDYMATVERGVARRQARAKVRAAYHRSKLPATDRKELEGRSEADSELLSIIEAELQKSRGTSPGDTNGELVRREDKKPRHDDG